MKALRTVALSVVLFLWGGSTAPAYAADLEKMAAELARLRSEVEVLATDLDELKAEEKQRLQSLGQQKAGLEAEAQREELRLRQLQQEIGRVQESIKAAGMLESELKPAVLDAIRAVMGPVQAGLPFRVSERLADLQRLERDLQADELLPSAAASRLWSRVEDELRLARENGLYQQVVEVDGREVLADVARVGMVMMFFRTDDETFGRAVKKVGEWSFESYVDEAQRERVKKLFEALDKRIRIGFFALPNALHTEVSR